MVNNMLAENVVQESNSPWASPIVLAKKDGSLRFCMDYRRLNVVTRKDAFPLPHINDLLDKMRGKSVFSTLMPRQATGSFRWRILVRRLPL